MEQDKELDAAIAQMERYRTEPMATVLLLAHILRDERDARRAMVRQAAHHGERLEGEITERSQRQLEITGRLAALERRMAMRDVVVEPRRETVRGCYQDPEHDTPWCAVHDEIPDWSGEILGWSGRAGWVCAKGGLVAETPDGVRRDRAKVRDLEAKVAVLQKAIDDVWALVENPDGYGSPYWTEPGLDDTTLAISVELVLAHLRRVFDQEHAVVVERAKDYTDELTEALGYAPGSIAWSRGLDLVRETILQRNGAREQVSTQAKAITLQAGRIRTLEERNTTQAFTIAQYEETPRAEAMAALNAADRQSDDDQICGC